MLADAVRVALAAGVCVSELRAAEGICVEVAATAAVCGPSPPVLADQRYDLCGHHLTSAFSEEQFQTVGLICREALISTAQAVFVPERHPPIDGIAPSATDAERMLEAYLAVELAGGANDEPRRSALDLAVNLQHRRTAAFRPAALCAEATTSVINIVPIVSGRRDPQ